LGSCWIAVIRPAESLMVTTVAGYTGMIENLLELGGG